MTLSLFEVLFLPLLLVALRILYKHGLLNENSFGVFLVAYLSIVAATASQLFPTMSAGRISGLVLSILCWFPGYPMARWIYRQAVPPK